ncbi:MAG: 3-phosphoshikimate 1-carboxyvinyltransferase [Ruminococcaceae bacterium]|nr:3-phosphoshikimate 1-carboxyvinyltransferase [Oscillospiraceae bacterium]
MKVKIEKGCANGKINAPPSKSMAHRLLISAAMCDGVSTVRGISNCEDVAATLDCLDSLGIKTERIGNDVKVFGRDFRGVKPGKPLICRESGSTLRFMIPASMLSGQTTVFYGAESLMKRPMGVYENLFIRMGLTYISDGTSIVVKGPLTGGEYTLAGNVSSQFISGLIFALPTADGDSTIKITTPIESRSYINLTMNAVRAFGIQVEWTDEFTINIPGSQKYRATDVTVEGDYSGAAFPDALNLFGGKVEITGLNPESIQGDSVYKRYFDMLTSGVPTIHIGDCPDLGPVLFAIAAAKYGGIFCGTKRLKIKESDRAEAMARELKKFGASVSVYEDSVVIYPVDFHAPSEVLSGHNDHRIVMSLAILLTLTGGIIDGAEAVAKSYPEFFDNLKNLGISVSELA